MTRLKARPASGETGRLTAAHETSRRHELGDWPNSDCSRFVHAAGLDWHVQIAGQGPDLLLVHGAGGATHSWRDLLPRLAQHFRVVAPDLPGHGFTDATPASQATLNGMAAALSKLLHVLDIEPAYAVGHSAGAAILVRMCLDGLIQPRAMMAINGAFKPFGGMAGQIFSPLAKMLSLNPLVPRLFAWSASSPDSVARLIRDTGSRLDHRGLALYRRLFADPRHVSGALRMMANWDLTTLAGDMARLQMPLTLVAGAADKAVAPAQAAEIGGAVEAAQVMRLPKLGHLAHEEDPAKFVELILAMVEAHPEH